MQHYKASNSSQNHPSDLKIFKVLQHVANKVIWNLEIDSVNPDTRATPPYSALAGIAARGFNSIHIVDISNVPTNRTDPLCQAFSAMSLVGSK